MVLLIDDDLVSREVTATVLTMSGYTVHTAENGDQAMEMLAQGVCRPGAVLVDAQMPGLSGPELVAKLREACRQACIYIMSATQPDASLLSAADGLLLKPFKPEALNKLLEGHADHIIQSRLDADEPVVSPEVLGQLRQLMPESAVREIYVAMLADLRRRLEKLGVAISNRDTEEIRRIGHAIKGGCGMAGAVQAARLGQLLEAGAAQGDDNYLDNSRALLQDLRAAARGLQRILDAELPT